MWSDFIAAFNLLKVILQQFKGEKISRDILNRFAAADADFNNIPHYTGFYWCVPFFSSVFAVVVPKSIGNCEK